MKNLIILGIFILMLAVFTDANAQHGKLDTIYYLLDTAATSAKDRIFTFEREGPAMIYGLQCRCYPYGLDVNFIYNIERHKEKRISMTEFNKLNKVSIVELIDIARKCLPPADPMKYKFGIIEPDGENMKIIYMFLGRPYEPRPVE